MTHPLADWVRAQARPIAHLDVDGPAADLAPLAARLAGARIVGWGEGLHGALEPLQLGTRLLEHLVEHAGVTGVAFESGLVQGFELDRWVQGGPGELAEVMARGFTVFGDQPPYSRLLQRLRERNRRPGARPPVRVFGMDLSCRPADMQAPLWQALDGLRALAPAAAEALHARVAELRPWLQLDRMHGGPQQYTALDPTQRDRLTTAVADLVAHLAVHAVEYAGILSPEAFARLLRTAEAARQVDDYLRCLPLGWTPAQGLQALAGTVAAADRAKADNVDWILQQLGPRGRLLLFAHRDHLATARSTIRLPGRFEAWALPPMVGEHLRLRHGRDYLSIAHLFSESAMTPGGRSGDTAAEPVGRAPAGSLEQALAAAGAGACWLDLREAPPEAAAWLAQPRELFGLPPFNTTVPGRAHDLLVYLPRVTPSR